MGAGGDGLTGTGMGGTRGSGVLRDYTDEDLYDDKFEYNSHYRPPRIKYNQWKNSLLRFWYLVKAFLGSK